jgi:tyrosyl-tRNA synthetase
MREPSEHQRTLAAEVAKRLVETSLAQGREEAVRKLFSKDQLKQIDEWLKLQSEPIDRPEAIRRLVEIGLKAKK